MAMMLDMFLSNFRELLQQMITDEVGMLLGIPGQMEKLSETICDIHCILADAERKQRNNSAIESWLMQLKDVMYDAKDVIDLCQIKAKERHAGSSCLFLSCFCNMLLAHRISSKLKNIISRLEGIAKRKADLGLTTELLIIHEPVRRVNSRITRKTDHLVILEDIVGEKIEEDAELLVNWLTEQEKHMHQNVYVAAIVGIGGIGKTTLAKRIFNDPRIQDAFDLKFWVCVSREVKGVELLKGIIRHVGGNHDASMEISELVPRIERLVQYKRFLLVLDDVWVETQGVWNNLLRAPMSSGHQGSKLIITTRNERVAKGMRAEISHRVDKLSDKDGWSLLIKQVARNGEGSDIQDLKDIGMQIVKKCDGLPLAIKSVGGILCTKGKTISNWKEVHLSMDKVLRNVHNMVYLGFEDLLPPSDHVHQLDLITNRMTDPSLVLDDIVGETNEEDAQLFINWLTQEEKGVCQNLRVAAIMGMGGVGKTTLVKRIFNDRRIRNAFDLTIWICISKERKGIEVLKCIIREAGGDHGNAKDRSELVPLLESLIQQRRFLLVLDDVWEETQDVWNNLLRAPMSSGHHGSKLIITTRNERVAKGMRAEILHRVDKLSDKDGWSLLIKQVAPIEVESEIQDLKDIGMQIVKKCDGLPLAIKSVAGTLCMKGKTISDWKEVLLSMDKVLRDVHQMLCLGLEDLPPPSDQICQLDLITNRMTDPTIVLDDIVGEKIEEDAKLLVNWLTEEQKHMRQNVCVAAIMGMGGIGKTILAKRIFNDPRIQDAFDLKIWVCVSKDVYGVDLLRCIIREAGGDHGNAREISELVPLLESVIQQRRFLLVLDDVWEETQDVWNNLLRAPMNGGHHGSKLIITTRNERVAKDMGAEKSHHVDELSDKDGWSLLIKQVAPIEVESEIDQDLKDVGMQIVKKCYGLPLVIKSIGNVLCTKDNTRDNWLAVLSSMDELQGDVHHSFYLSYKDLPPPLKLCIIFCSLFPKDFVFHKTSIIYMWQVEGFLQDNHHFWEVGDAYYMELLLGNFLEVVGPSYFQVQCKMHGIWWSFTRQFGKHENYVLGEGQVLSRSENFMKVQRLLIDGNEVKTEVIKKAKGLRTLLLHFKPEIALHDMCKGFSNLRILDLNHPTFSNIPDSLCDLVYLRYLNISGSNIRNLPNSIGNLKNLIYLNLANCEELLHLPHSIINLLELKLLNTYNSGVEAIPAGLNKLNKLNELHGFKPHQNNLEGCSSLDELETLSELIILGLDCLENVSDINIAKIANLQSKNQLQNLYLKYTSLSPEEQLSQTNEKKLMIEDVLNELLLPSSLEILKIEGYFGINLPKWFNLGPTFHNLRFLQINNCASFEGLAPLGQLPNLDFLQIIGACSVLSVGEQFLWTETSSHTIPAFPKLSQLIFDGMPIWKEWQWNKGQPAMPNLKKLFIIGCPQLRSLPEGLLHHATSMEYLEIHGADELTTIENLSSIKDIHVSRNRNLERISNLDSVSSIVIYDCSNLKVVENLNVLETMALTDFGMKILPNYLMTTVPQKLRIQCSEKLFLEIATQGESGSELGKFMHINTVKINSYSCCYGSLCATYQQAPFSFTTNVRTRSVQK